MPGNMPGNAEDWVGVYPQGAVSDWVNKNVATKQMKSFYDAIKECSGREQLSFEGTLYIGGLDTLKRAEP